MEKIGRSLLKKIKQLTLLDVVMGMVVLFVLLFILFFFIKKDSWTKIEVKVRSYPSSSGGQLDGAPNFWLSKNIKPRDSQKDSAGRKIATIEAVKRWGDLANETWITVNINARKDKTGVLRFNYQDIVIGNPVKFQFGPYGLEGIVTHIDGVADDRTKTDIAVKARVIDWSVKNSETLGVFPWVASAIHKGEVMTTLNGDVVATIDSAEIFQADRVVTTADGRLVMQKDPSKRDVFLTLKMSVTKTDQTYFFLEDYPVKIDAEVPLYFPKYKILIRITDIL